MTAKEILNKAKQHGVCGMLTGKESTAELCNLLFTPQGIEFCTTYNFPNIDALRSLESDILMDNNVFIDAKEIEMSNVRRVFIAGDTKATLTYNDPNKRHEVILMHGAKAIIKASNYAVVFVTNSNGTVEKFKDNTAEIL